LTIKNELVVVLIGSSTEDGVKIYGVSCMELKIWEQTEDVVNDCVFVDLIGKLGEIRKNPVRGGSI